MTSPKLATALAVLLASTPAFADSRLSLVSGDPAAESDAVAGSIYFVDVGGDSQLTLALTSTAHAANSNFDVYQVTEGICTGPAWASNTERGSSAGIASVSGQFVNSTAISCKNGANTWSVAAHSGVLLGGFRTDGIAGETRDTASDRLLWNLNGPRLLPVSRADTADNWPYSDADFRQANGSGSNRIASFNGMAGRPADITANGYMLGTTSAVRSGFVGVGIDSSTADASQIKTPCAGSNSFPVLPCYARFVGFAGIGYHEFRWLERGVGYGDQTWRGDNGYSYGYQTGLIGFVLQ